MATITRLDHARERHAAAYWRGIIMREERLRTLRDGLMRFALGCTRDDADKVVAQIMADFGWRADQVPTVVDVLARASGFGPHATVLFLYQFAAVARTVPGARLIREMARILACLEAEAAGPSH
jgi:hypothetical protein